MKVGSWANNLPRHWTYALLLVLLAGTYIGPLGADQEQNSAVSRYLAARKEDNVVTNVPPHLLASPKASLRNLVLEIRGDIVAITTSGQDLADLPGSCLLVQTSEGVTVPLDYWQHTTPVGVGQRVAVLAKLSDDPQKQGQFRVEHLILEQDLPAALRGDAPDASSNSSPTDGGSAAPIAPSGAGSAGGGGQIPPQLTDQDLYAPATIKVWQSWIAQYNPQLSDIERDRIVRWVLYHSHSYGVDHRLIFSVILAESNFAPNCRSGAGAQGLMQLMPGTARSLGVTDAFYIPENIRGGVEYLAQFLQKYRGESYYRQCVLALACYNAGPNAVKRYGGVPPFPETRRYVVKVAQQFNDLVKAGYP